MVAKRKSQLPTNHKPAAEDPAADEIKYELISTDLIDDPAAPMRGDLTPQSVEELAISIKQVGIIEPLIVKPKNGRYEVIAGHRRLYAAKLVKLLQVPCNIRAASKEETEILKIHENLYRADVSPAEEAKYFTYLIKEHKMSPNQIAQFMAKSPSYVHDRLSILNWPDFLTTAMQNGDITFAVAREFSRFADLQQMQAAVYYAKRNGMTSDTARKWVLDHNRAKEQPQIQEQTTYNPETKTQEVEHTINCIYCGKPGKLYEMQMVYLHPKCLEIATTPDVETKPTQ